MLLSSSLWANLEGKNWVFHGSTQDYIFPRAGDLRGSPMVSLKKVAQGVGLDFFYNPKTNQGYLEGRRSKRKVSFELQNPQVKGFWGSSQLSKGPMFLNEELVVPVDFADKALRPLLTGQAPVAPLAPSSLFQADIVIDAGHGGNDWGAHVKVGADIVKEKDLSLAIAKELCQKIRAQKLNCLLTRDADNYLTLHERTQFANRAQAKVFLSIHLNAEAETLKKSPKNKSRSSSGFEMYVLSLNTEDGSRAAVAEENQMIPEDLPEGVDKAVANLKAESLFESSLSWAKAIASILSPLRPSFGKAIKAGPFYVLYGANMPSVLVELGFITNEGDRVQLRSPSQRALLLAPMAQGLAEHLKKGIVQK